MKRLFVFLISFLLFALAAEAQTLLKVVYFVDGTTLTCTSIQYLDDGTVLGTMADGTTFTVQADYISRIEIQPAGAPSDNNNQNNSDNSVVNRVVQDVQAMQDDAPQDSQQSGSNNTPIVFLRSGYAKYTASGGGFSESDWTFYGFSDVRRLRENGFVTSTLIGWLDRGWKITSDNRVLVRGLSFAYRPGYAIRLSDKMNFSLTVGPYLSFDLYGSTYSGDDIIRLRDMDNWRRFDIGFSEEICFIINHWQFYIGGFDGLLPMKSDSKIKFSALTIGVGYSL